MLLGSATDSPAGKHYVEVDSTVRIQDQRLDSGHWQTPSRATKPLLHFPAVLRCPGP